MRRDHVALTLIRRHFDVVCLLGGRLIIFYIQANINIRQILITALTDMCRVMRKYVLWVYANSVGSDQPARPRSLKWAFAHPWILKNCSVESKGTGVCTLHMLEETFLLCGALLIPVCSWQLEKSCMEQLSCLMSMLRVKGLWTAYRLGKRLFGSIVYNRAIVYKRQNFLQIVVHVIITDQCN